MKKFTWIVLVVVISLFPGLSFAKGVPLFLQTGDELFEIEGSPTFEEGYSVGFACKRFGIFGADFWTWDCELMAINIEEFAAGDLEPAFKAEMEAKYSLDDRERSVWNHYGAIFLSLVLIGGIAVKAKN
jgi:hypothetical protein